MLKPRQHSTLPLIWQPWRCIHTYVLTYIHILAHIHAYIHTHAHVIKNTHSNTYSHTHTQNTWTGPKMQRKRGTSSSLARIQHPKQLHAWNVFGRGRLWRGPSRATPSAFQHRRLYGDGAPVLWGDFRHVRPGTREVWGGFAWAGASASGCQARIGTLDVCMLVRVRVTLRVYTFLMGRRGRSFVFWYTWTGWRHTSLNVIISK